MPTLRRIDALDGLRAVAVGIVVLSHVTSFAPGGFVGVDIFFVLSGYLITSILVNEFETRGDISFRHFYLRRAARLMPGLAVLLVAALLARAITRHYGLKEIILAGTYTMNWARALGVGDSSILGHTWSVGIEEQFYLLWPPILLAVLRWRPTVAPMAACTLAMFSAISSISLYVSGASAMRTYNGFDTRAVELLVGCTVAFLPLGGRFAGILARFWLVPVLAFAGALRMDWTSPILPLGGYGFLAVMGGWLIIALRKDAPPAALLRQPVIVYLGRISYGLYLWHYLLLGLCDASGLNTFGQVAIALPLTVVFAALSYHFVETPILAATRSQLSGRRLASASGGGSV